MTPKEIHFLVVFQKRQIIKSHNLEAVYEGKKPFKCNICDTGFSQKKKHVASVYEGRKLNCNFCDKSFQIKAI